MKQVVGRFAPSPSGRMHLGNLFSAVLAWCSVRAASGTMVLRLEDLDPDRCRPEYGDAIKDDLRWLGLDWDREQTPQSLRTDAYRQEFKKLESLGLVYPCYCTRNELHAVSAPHASDGNPIYPGTCRTLTARQRCEKDRTPCWRVCVPDETVCFTDGVQGVYAQELQKDCGDFIVRRSDGVYAYQLAVVTDDAAAGVTQVVRGCDLLPSTPRQLWLQRTLGFAEPEYCHVPLLLAPDGRRLSKREHDLDMGELRARYAPQQLLGLIGYLAGLLEKPSFIRAQELAEAFSWEKIRKENIVIGSGAL